ncbi:MAG: ATP-binding protein [Solirubrobacteraceae bacterium]
MHLLNRLPLRIRLTAAFAGAAAVLLAGIGTFILLSVESGLDGQIDHALRLRAGELAEAAPHPQAARTIIDAAGQPGQVLGVDGSVIVSERVRGARPLIGPVHLAAARRGEVSFESRERTRIMGLPAGSGRIVAVAASMRQREQTVETLQGVLLIGLPIVLLLASAAGYAVARGALGPVERMRRHAAGISDATSGARLPLPPAADELHRLGETINGMLDRLDTAARNEREFLATASHELRTPLAILKAEIEVALREDSTPADWQFALVSAGEETDRLVRLAEDLLLIARGEERNAPPDLHEVSLAGLIARVVERTGGGDVVQSVDPGLSVLVEPDALERALANLLDNARRHGAPPITVSARADGEFVALHVADHGGGFAPDYLPHAFERFTRPPGARAPGAGLGLALVEAVAHAHGGTAGAANANGGANVWLTLPGAHS